MRLFPQTHEFILNELLKVNLPNANYLYQILSNENELFRNHSYEELLQAFSIFLNNLTEEPDENDNELNVDNAREIQSLIEACKDFIYMTFTTKLIASNYDICALLLIIKKCNELNLNNIENEEDFINNIVAQLGNPITIGQVIEKPTLIDYLSYDNILDDAFMSELYFFHNHTANNPPQVQELISGKYSYLFLNELYKSNTYNNLDLNNGPNIEPNSIDFTQFKNDLLTYNPKALTYSDEWRADRESVILAISNFPKALSYASDELKADREIVLTARANGLVLEFVAELLSDREVVLKAVKNLVLYWNMRQMI